MKTVDKHRDELIELVGYRVGGDGYHLPEPVADGLLKAVDKLPLDASPEAAFPVALEALKRLGVTDRAKIKDAQNDVFGYVNWLKHETDAEAWMADSPILKTGTQLKTEDLREFFAKMPDGVDVFFERVWGLGNIEGAYVVRKDIYGFFGHSIPCVIIGPATIDVNTVWERLNEKFQGAEK